MAHEKQTTLYVVAYDVPEDRRRTRIHKILSGFGQWTQFSLFECYLTDKEYLRLRQLLERHMSDSQDSVRFYPLCQACRGGVETVGSKPPAEPGMYVV